MHDPVEDKWYEMQDLIVQNVLPQIVPLSEAYLQIYELKTVSSENAMFTAEPGQEMEKVD